MDSYAKLRIRYIRQVTRLQSLKIGSKAYINQANNIVKTLVLLKSIERLNA
jgi:hypothetical protein